jgi:hypothetical protein
MNTETFTHATKTGPSTEYRERLIKTCGLRQQRRGTKKALTKALRSQRPGIGRVDASLLFSKLALKSYQVDRAQIQRLLEDLYHAPRPGACESMHIWHYTNAEGVKSTRAVVVGGRIPAQPIRIKGAYNRAVLTKVGAQGWI